MWAMVMSLQIAAFSSRATRVVTTQSGCYCRSLARPHVKELPTSVEHQVELTAESLWGEVSSRLRGALNDTTYRTWFDDVEGEDLTDDTFVLRVPNDFAREWIEGHFLGLIKAAVKDSIGHERRVSLRVVEGHSPGGLPEPLPAEVERPPKRGEAGMNPKYIFDLFVIGSSNRFAHAAALAVAEAPAQAYNPLFIYGGNGTREDPPDAGDRPVRDAALTGHERPLRHERDLHERLHQLAPRQADRGLQAALPRLRPPARRRRPVLRAQGADPGGILPHVQLALRGRQPDRDVVRPAAPRDLDPRGAAALALRVGPDHRHPAPRPRDPDRDPPQEGQDRRHPRARPAGADLRRRAGSSRTSASSKVRSPASSRSHR